MSVEDRTFTLADSFDRIHRLRPDLTAPLPLGYANAIRRALQLLEANPNLPYTAVAQVMSEYHGIHRSPKWWARELRAAGAPHRGRGVMWCGKERIPA